MSTVNDFIVPQGVLRVEVVAPHTFRIRLRPDASFRPAVLHRYGILKHPTHKVDLLESRSDADSHVIRTAAASLSISKTDGRLTLRDAEGKTLLQETAAPWSDAEQGFGAEFQLETGERLYGLGDISRECLNRRGMNALIWVKDVTSYVPIPYLMSSRGWAMLVNTTWKHQIDIGKSKSDRLRFGGNEGELDYYLFVGNSSGALLDRYTDVAGKPSLLPLTGYGLTFCCNQQANAREMLDDCLNFRREGIPCDHIELEPGWLSKYQPAEQVINTYDFSLEKTWHPERFYIPGWIQNGGPGTFMYAARSMGFKLTLWMCCDYDLSYEEERRAAGRQAKEVEASPKGPPHFHEDAVENDALLQTTVLMDPVTRPEEPWFNHLKKFVDQGATGFKLDGAMQVLEHPDRKWGNGMSDLEMHNLYPVIYDKQMHQGFAEHTGHRSLIYSAGGYIGVQQFVATWAGDTGGGAKPLVSLLKPGLRGPVNTSCDMEVFTPAGIHFGFFQPWSQVCSWAYWRHPWMLGDELLPMFKFYAHLRYRLLPYIYSAAHVAHRTGMPIVRAMPLAFPNDPKSDELLGQYLFGDSFLVAAFTDQVHLPAGRWIDYWTGEVHEGPKDMTYRNPPGRGGALFVRAGAVIPEWPQMDYVGQKPVDEITLRIHPHGQSQFTLYEDDGISHEYLNGAVASTRIVCRAEGKHVDLEIAPRSGQYSGMPQHRRFDIWIDAPVSPKAVQIQPRPASVLAGEQASWHYDPQTKAVRIRAAEDAERKQPLVIRCEF